VRGGHAVGKAGIRLQRAVFQDLHRLRSATLKGTDLIVLAMHHQNWDVDGLEIFEKLGFLGDFMSMGVLRQNSMLVENSATPAAMAGTSRSSFHARTPRICPGEAERREYISIYKDGGTWTFSRRCVGSD